MSTIITPNMSMPLPVPGQEAGPTWADDLNASLTLVDSHDHSPGRGVQITPNGLNINALLTMNNNLLGSIAGLNLTAQSVTPAINTIYESGIDLYFVDGLGNNIRLTQSGGVAGAPGSISNLTAPASASYVAGSSKFVWQSNANIAANMDFGSAIMRNISPNSTFALTLQPPGSLASNYSITLPTLPVSQSIMTIDSSGIIGTPGVYPLTAASIASHTITAGQITAGTITTTEIAANTILGSNINASANILGTQLAAAAGILPAQNDTLSSGNYVKVGSNSPITASYTTSQVAGSPIDIINASTMATSRPIFCNFTGSIAVPVGVSISIQLYYTVGASFATISTQTLGNGSSGTITFPASVLNQVSLDGINFNSLRYRISSFTGTGTVTLTGVTFTAFQV